MSTNLRKTILAIALFVPIALFLVLSSCSESEDPPEPPVAPTLSYDDTEVAVGAEGSVTATKDGDAATYAISDDGGAAFVTVDAATGNLSVAKESTIGVYEVKVKATNEGGEVEATAKITIGINSAFDPTGKKMIWKYFMNYTPDIVMKNLNTLPGLSDLPAEIPLPDDGFPEGWPTNINPADPLFSSYFILTGVQELLLQVPGDMACGALSPAEQGDTLIVIVDEDLKLWTQCRADGGAAGTVVEIGTSSISYANDGFVWAINTTIQGQPVTIAIADAVIADFVDPLHPHYSMPSMQGGMYSAVQGSVEQLLIPTNFEDLEDLSKLELKFVTVDIVLEVLAE